MSRSPKCFDAVEPMRRWVTSHQRSGKTVGVVPTMGALHAGHLSLVRAAQQESDLCVVTIFVNPTQFAAGEDLHRYPRPLERDLEQLAELGVDSVFLPTNDVMYPAGFGTYVQPPSIAGPLEGDFRPTHFRGVATVVMKLFQIIPADVAVFGQKDYQQWKVIERMAIDLNVATRVIGCPIVREPDGLAMSSRNVYLTAPERQIALSLNRALTETSGQIRKGVTEVASLEAQMRRIVSEVDRVDYAVIVDAQTLLPIAEVDRPAVALLAVYVGSTRLIDNRLLTPAKALASS